MQVEAQFADTLFLLERLQAVRLAIWGGASVLLGTSLLAFLRVARRESSVLLQFGIQCAAWGAFWIAFAGAWRSSTHLRDLAGAVELDRAAWFSLGIASAVVVCGAILILVGRGQRDGGALVGAAVGAMTQGLAVVVLALQLSAAVVR